VDAEKPTYAGFWLRLAATLIDLVLLTVIALPLTLLAPPLLPAERLLSGAPLTPQELLLLIGGPRGVLLNVVLLVAATAALVWFWKARAATPGKMALGLHVVDARSGGPLSTGQCIGRALAYLVSTIPLGIGFLWIAFDARKQAWHDKLSGSVVIRAPKRPAG